MTHCAFRRSRVIFLISSQTNVVSKYISLRFSLGLNYIVKKLKLSAPFSFRAEEANNLNTKMNTSISSLILVLVAISPFVLIANGQFSAVSGILGNIGTALGHSVRNDQTRLLEHPASGKCMNIERALIGSGIRIIMYDCNWRGGFTPVNELFSFNHVNGAYLIKGAASNSNMCLYTGNNYNDPLYTIGCGKNDRRQHFEFRKHGHDQYQLVQRSTGRCLRADGRRNGAGIRTVNCNSNDHDQKWRVCSGSRNCNV